jgi:CHAT domain-containing protein
MFQQAPRPVSHSSGLVFSHLFILSLLFATAKLGCGQNAEPSTVPDLEAGKPIEGEIAAKEKRSYQISLAENQFASIVVEQHGIDVIVRAFNKTDDRPIAQRDLALKTEGREEIGFVASAAGIHRLEIEAKATSTAKGRYSVLLAESRPATEKELHLEEARKLHNQAVVLWRAAKYNEAKSASERALAIREAELGPEDLDVAASLANLALITLQLGDYEKTISLQLRAVRIREKIYGPYHADISRTLHNMAEAYLAAGNYEKATEIYNRVIEIDEKVSGPDDVGLATSLNDLGEVYRVLGNYDKAEQLVRRALDIEQKGLPPNSLITAFSLSSRANLYGDKDDTDKALEFHQRALEMWEKTSGPNHPNTALGLTGVADQYRERGDYKAAEANYLRALGILQKAYGEKHLRIAGTLANLAILYSLWGDFPKAEPYFQQSLAMFENTVGKEHSEYADALYFLATFYTDTGQYQRAESLFEEAIARTEKALGPQHPHTIRCLDGLARNHQAQGKTAQAVDLCARAHLLSEHNTQLLLSTDSERQKLSHLKALSAETNQYISAHLKYAPDNPAALELALTTILERKGRVSDATASELAALRSRADKEDRALLDELKEVTSGLAQRIWNVPPNITADRYQKQLTQFEERKETLETEIRRKSSEFRAQMQPVTIAAIRSLIPPDAALIEFSIYRPFDAKEANADKRFGEPRLAAYVIRQQGPIQWRDLGPTRPVEEAVETLRQSLGDPKRKDSRQFSRILDEKIMQPIRSICADTTRFLISPDGELNLIPFEALVDENDAYLVQKYSFTYLTSGRDLLRMEIARASKSTDLLIANPRFGDAPAVQLASANRSGNKPGRLRKSVTVTQNLSDTYFAPLSGTLQEARMIQAMFPDAVFLTGTAATEAALKQVNAPRFLHIATHGYFLSEPLSPPKESLQNPLLRSGLALANANQHGTATGSGDDGVLTALEASGLNLWGTKLVVLSACDTGLGEVKNGEGVYGLRRAFVLAGAESLVMSLWPVSDYSTRRLMADYYKHLKQGQGRGEALRTVQLQLLKANPKLHPFYWANFIQIGEWGNLDGRR